MSRGRLWKGVVDWLWSRRQVGEDVYHRYYAEFTGRGKPDRRYVEYKDGNHIHASDRMDTEWWSWLHHRRDVPPTQQELEGKRNQKQILAQRVQAIEVEEERRRLRSSLQSQTHQNNNTRSSNGSIDDVIAHRRRKVSMRLQQAALPKETSTALSEIHPMTSRPVPSSISRPKPSKSNALIKNADVDDHSVREEPTVSFTA